MAIKKKIEHKVEEPKVEEPKVEEPKVEEPKDLGTLSGKKIVKIGARAVGSITVKEYLLEDGSIQLLTDDSAKQLVQK